MPRTFQLAKVTLQFEDCILYNSTGELQYCYNNCMELNQTGQNI